MEMEAQGLLGKGLLFLPGSFQPAQDMEQGGRDPNEAMGGYGVRRG